MEVVAPLDKGELRLHTKQSSCVSIVFMVMWHTQRLRSSLLVTGRATGTQHCSDSGGEKAGGFPHRHQVQSASGNLLMGFYNLYEVSRL